MTDSFKKQESDKSNRPANHKIGRQQLLHCNWLNNPAKW